MPIVGDAKRLRGEIVLWVRAVFRGWVAATTGSGLVAVIGTYVAVSGPSAEIVRAGGWVVFTIALIVGLFQAWQREYRRRGKLEATPALRLHFVPGEAPYEQDDQAELDEASSHWGCYSHHVRVGVTHDGPKHVEEVRVVVASIDPLPEGFPIKRALAPMDEPGGTSTCSIAAGPEPTRFFDVLVDERTLFTVSSSDDPEPRPVVHEVGAPEVCFTSGGRGLPKATAIGMRLMAEGRDARSAELRLALTYSRGLVPEIQVRPA